MKFTERNRIKELIELANNNHNEVMSISLELNNIDNYLEFIIESDQWANAVDPLQIADPNSEEDKILRAKGIINLMLPDLLDETHLLDFGCGEGHISIEASKNKYTKMSVGYDVKKQWKDIELPNLKLTTNWNDVIEHSPYQNILVYDALDHVENEEMVNICLKKMSEVLSKNGKIHLRMHPWCSRHGTHLYHQKNKAFLHLCLEEEALINKGLKPMQTIKVIHPVMTYNKWFKDANLEIENMNIKKRVVEPFFKEILSKPITKHWKNSHEPKLANGEFPTFQLEQEFIDYVLTK